MVVCLGLVVCVLLFGVCGLLVYCVGLIVLPGALLTGSLVRFCCWRICWLFDRFVFCGGIGFLFCLWGGFVLCVCFGFVGWC